MGVQFHAVDYGNGGGLYFEVHFEGGEKYYMYIGDYTVGNDGLQNGNIGLPSGGGYISWSLAEQIRQQILGINTEPLPGPHPRRHSIAGATLIGGF